MIVWWQVVGRLATIGMALPPKGAKALRTGDFSVAHEQHLSGVSGRSSDGRALAHHSAPSFDLAPWVARLFVTVADQPADHLLSCGLFNDTAFVRVLVRGDWIAETVHGHAAGTRA